jgi:hypothetical protein
MPCGGHGMYSARASRASEELAAILTERSTESAVCPAKHIPGEPFAKYGALQEEGDMVQREYWLSLSRSRDGLLSGHYRSVIMSSMREVALLFREMVSAMDADVLIAISVKSSLDILRPIYEYCASRGLRPEGEAIRVGDWPVQFIPAFSPLTEEALHEAEIVEVEGVPLRVVRATHLGVIALSTGRPKDYARILSLLESGSVSRDDLRRLADRHGLSAAWQRFQARFLEP